MLPGGGSRPPPALPGRTPPRGLPAALWEALKRREGRWIVISMFWPRFWCSWGRLGSFSASLSTLEHPTWPPKSPQQRSRRPHSEADRPARPPKPLGRRLATYFPSILMAKSGGRGGEHIGTLTAHHNGSWAQWRCRRAAL